MLHLLIQTDKLDGFLIQFPLDRDQLDAIMANDYPDARVTRIDIKARR